MKIYETKQVTKEVKIPKSMICDKCEKEIEIYPEHPDNGAYTTFQISAGYGSRHDFLSNEYSGWNFDICDDCTTEFLKTFKKDYLNPYCDDDL